jgi:hypothetical protein
MPRPVLMTMRSPISRSSAFVQAVPHRLGQRGAGIEEHAHAREQVARSASSVFMAVAMASKPLGTLKYTVGAISRRLRRVSAMQRRRGLAVVDVQRAAVVDAMPKLWLPPKVWFQGSQSTSTGGSSASTGMLWRICCWLAHHMRWVLITALGSLVEPLVNRNLAMVSGPVACMAASTPGSAPWPAGRQRRDCWRGTGQLASGQHHFQVCADDSANRAAITRAIGGEHQARRHRLEHVAQLGEVGADQRVGGRGRHIGHTGHQAAQRQQRVLQVVFGQDDHRPFGTQSPVDQPLRDGARAGQASP